MYTVEVTIDRRWGARQVKVQLGKLIRGKETAKENAADRVMYWLVTQELRRLDIELVVEDLDK